MWFGSMPSCHWSSASPNNDHDIWLFVQWGPQKPVNCAPQSLSILLLFNSTSERLLACWTEGRCRDLNYSAGQIERYLFCGNVGNQEAFFAVDVLTHHIVFHYILYTIDYSICNFHQKYIWMLHLWTCIHKLSRSITMPNFTAEMFTAWFRQSWSL